MGFAEQSPDQQATVSAICLGLDIVPELPGPTYGADSVTPVLERGDGGSKIRDDHTRSWFPIGHQYLAADHDTLSQSVNTGCLSPSAFATPAP